MAINAMPRAAKSTASVTVADTTIPGFDAITVDCAPKTGRPTVFLSVATLFLGVAAPFLGVAALFLGVAAPLSDAVTRPAIRPRPA
ncbi:hypothetical protein [Microbispora sp. CSR-4]|uniref:hypothetical protein n=1 Tax=Microbispora sp. CSR-4 TaxID=2592813 RepID=UPI0011CBA2AA|nr:hypothetical protein [Microbispora sp. CSR-4]